MRAGAADASGIAMEIDPAAYDQLGEHLRNDRKQSHYVMWATAAAAVASIMFLLWMIFWQPVHG